ncbi:hypothetical protein F5877DRAFT_1412, partial [Lentinula edodes]
PHPNPPFELPLAGNLSLHIRLGEMISEGRTGMVFDCECSIPCGNETLGYQIPPIVVKLATQYHSEDMTKEAIMYEGLQCLQGSVIPQCYGFFQFRWYCGCLLKQFLSSTDFFDFGPMSILLLEKLGGHLTLGKPLPNGAECVIDTSSSITLNSHQLCFVGVRSELESLCIDLASLHIIHNDLRYANILCVLSQEQGGLPSLPSPISGRSYQWRLIDLDRAYRT